MDITCCPCIMFSNFLLRLPVLVDFICTSLTRTRVVLNECAPSFHSIHFPSSRTYTGVRSCFVIFISSPSFTYARLRCTPLLSPCFHFFPNRRDRLYTVSVERAGPSALICCILRWFPTELTPPRFRLARIGRSAALDAADLYAFRSTISCMPFTSCIASSLLWCRSLTSKSPGNI